MDLDVAAVFLAPTPRQLAALLRDKHGLEDAELDAEGLDGLADGSWRRALRREPARAVRRRTC